MHDIQHPGAYDFHTSWLCGGCDDPEIQVRSTHRAASSSYDTQARNKARLTAAILYLVAAGFFGVIMSVIAATWGKDGFNQVLAAGNIARPTVIYLLVAGGYFLAASVLLLSPVSLSQPCRTVLLAFAFMLMLAGFVFAPPAAVVSMVPFWFLLKFHQEVTPHIAFGTNAQQQDSPAASAV